MVDFNSNIIILGASGAGKGTQAKKLAAEYNLTHLEMGDILRKLAKDNSNLGRRINQYISQGKFLPDEVINEIVEAELQKIPKNKGIIFDGVPRTIGQAQFLDEILVKEGRKKLIVLDLWVSPEKLVYRLLNRKICDKCGKLYCPPTSLKQTDCECGGKLVRRSDDTEEVIKNRIVEFEKKTQELIDYYQKKGNLIKINGEPSIDQVWEEIQEALKKV